MVLKFIIYERIWGVFCVWKAGIPMRIVRSSIIDNFVGNRLYDWKVSVSVSVGIGRKRVWVNIRYNIGGG